MEVHVSLQQFTREDIDSQVRYTDIVRYRTTVYSLVRYTILGCSILLYHSVTGT